MFMNIKIKNAIKIEKSILQITGRDKFDFLQPLITNDVKKIQNHPIYSLILTPKGRFISDFFLIYDKENDLILLETGVKYKNILMEKFAEYKLHSKTKIKDVSDSYQCFVLLNNEMTLKYQKIEEKSWIFQDPRSINLDYKLITHHAEVQNIIDDQNDSYDNYEQRCLENLILDSEKFMNERPIPLAFRMDEKNAIDFSKGCFLGQEITSIMKNRKTLNKKIYFVESKSELPEENQEIIFEAEKIGILLKKLSSNEGIMMFDLHHFEKLNIKNHVVKI